MVILADCNRVKNQAARTRLSAVLQASEHILTDVFIFKSLKEMDPSNVDVHERSKMAAPKTRTIKTVRNTNLDKSEFMTTVVLEPMFSFWSRVELDFFDTAQFIWYLSSIRCRKLYVRRRTNSRTIFGQTDVIHSGKHYILEAVVWYVGYELILVSDSFKKS